MKKCFLTSGPDLLLYYLLRTTCIDLLKRGSIKRIQMNRFDPNLFEYF